MSNNTINNCAVAPESTSTDAGIAGTGILLSFIISAFLALFLSAFIVFSEIRAQTSRNITRRILSGLSDSQIFQGIGIQAVGLAKVRTIIPYHFFIIWMLALLSTATNFAALLALVQDFKRDWVLRWLRQFAMFVNVVLTIVYGVFVLRTNLADLAPTLPMACVWQDHEKSEEAQGNKTLSIVGTAAAIAISAIVFVLGTWYLHMRKQTWGKSVRAFSLLVLLGVAIGAAVRVILVSQAFGTPSVKLDDAGETEWSFGQLLVMLLLILPFVSALEIFRGQMQVPHANAFADSDQMPLTSQYGREQKLDHDAEYTYQPNPLFRS
ncbi:unnamed protein product [Zymoseptoria tritici ST99CH_1A5]|uniref:Uncharacterized protein n=4 Tax=Zymoseptoria tritici TaxID=1047171 RepID=F9XHS7_ZYMTI|nr:uncharacterized protein MYCGRDRAFT_94877 [Zymoseptoria tritici IPO323]SMQ53005.1 unnamed protein product [Zymoseptoria tritici ST99CH_3D7]SMR56587.1 unnamed protein product [Zymoseptoria tritici ST99CH_1E4]SMR59443.1 unnamed protein product [Zymoseptoria tritici ST99CH_3D1]SMY26638.1 unnamed protein product [Zymoseptoria tritici ST99CH_1A5]EGP85525.1 hypothetical protein MYCGRDRAFT_94877 [Zymoseptoria tritici IPO323]